MNKDEKVSCLRASISDKAKRIEYILKNVFCYSESEAETMCMVDLAMEEATKIYRMSHLIGKILKH